MQRGLTHLDARGAARMVDVGPKPVVGREAVAEGWFVARKATLDRLLEGTLPKGEGLAVARIAGVLAAKRCDELVPLCHTLPLDHVAVDFERTAPTRLRIVSTVSVSARTGVEMEALVAVSIAALSLWDMTKAIDDDLRIEGIRLVSKTKRAPEQGTRERRSDGVAAARSAGRSESRAAGAGRSPRRAARKGSR